MHKCALWRVWLLLAAACNLHRFYFVNVTLAGADENDRWQHLKPQRLQPGQSNVPSEVPACCQFSRLWLRLLVLLLLVLLSCPKCSSFSSVACVACGMWRVACGMWCMSIHAGGCIAIRLPCHRVQLSGQQCRTCMMLWWCAGAAQAAGVYTSHTAGLLLWCTGTGQDGMYRAAFCSCLST